MRDTHVAYPYTVQCAQKKRNLTVRKVQNIFPLLIGVNSFWHHCIMVSYQKEFTSLNMEKMFCTFQPSF